MESGCAIPSIRQLSIYKVESKRHVVCILEQPPWSTVFRTVELVVSWGSCRKSATFPASRFQSSASGEGSGSYGMRRCSDFTLSEYRHDMRNPSGRRRPSTLRVSRARILSLFVIVSTTTVRCTWRKFNYDKARQGVACSASPSLRPFLWCDVLTRGCTKF